jgi:hypothetical protein
MAQATDAKTAAGPVEAVEVLAVRVKDPQGFFV